VFAGYAQQYLTDDPTYQAALAGRANRPAALVGRAIDVGLSTAAFPFDASPGRHLAVLGPSAAGADVLDAAARGIAVHHGAGTARFVIASLVAEGDEVAAALASAVGRRHQVERVDPAGLAAALDVDRPGYLVVFGMDALSPGTVPRDRLQRVLREGPARGVHLLSWWRGLRRFSEELGGSAAREDVAGMVFLNVPGPDVSLLLGRQVDWQPRANRALFHDRHADRTTVIVPFARPEHEPALPLDPTPPADPAQQPAPTQPPDPTATPGPAQPPGPGHQPGPAQPPGPAHQPGPAQQPGSGQSRRRGAGRAR
jgi:hypothetical protein